MSKPMHVFGAFKTLEGANGAANRLVETGIPRESVSVLVSERARERMATVVEHTKAAEGAASGGIVGGVLGGLAAGLTTVAAVALPGIGLLAAGPLVAALAGAGVGAAAGGTIGGLVGLGLPEHEIKRYSEILRTDGVVVSVTTFDKKVAEVAERTLEQAGALDTRTASGMPAHV